MSKFDTLSMFENFTVWLKTHRWLSIVSLATFLAFGYGSELARRGELSDSLLELAIVVPAFSIVGYFATLHGLIFLIAISRDN